MELSFAISLTIVLIIYIIGACLGEKVLWILTFGPLITLVVIGWRAYFNSRKKSS